MNNFRIQLILSALLESKRSFEFGLFCFPGRLTGRVKSVSFTKRSLVLTDGERDYSVLFEQLWYVVDCDKKIELNPPRKLTDDEFAEMINEWWENEHA